MIQIGKYHQLRSNLLLKRRKTRDLMVTAHVALVSGTMLGTSLLTHLIPNQLVQNKETGSYA